MSLMMCTKSGDHIHQPIFYSTECLIDLVDKYTNNYHEADIGCHYKQITFLNKQVFVYMATTAICDVYITKIEFIIS